MRADLIVVFHVRQQYVTKMSFAQHDDIIDAFPSDQPDQPFGISILPWGHGSSTVLSAKYIAAALTKRMFQMERTRATFFQTLPPAFCHSRKAIGTRAVAI